MSRGGDEQGGAELARPGAHRTREEREHQQRKEIREQRKADERRLAPYSSEQRMMGLLSELGERNRIDFQREYKIRDDQNDWYVTLVDFAWPDDRLVMKSTAASIATASSTLRGRANRTTPSALQGWKHAAGGC